MICRNDRELNLELFDKSLHRPSHLTLVEDESSLNQQEALLSHCDKHSLSDP